MLGPRLGLDNDALCGKKRLDIPAAHLGFFCPVAAARVFCRASAPGRGSADRLSPRGSQKKAAVTDGEPERDETASCQRLLLIGPLIIWPRSREQDASVRRCARLLLGFPPLQVCVCMPFCIQLLPFV